MAMTRQQRLAAVRAKTDFPVVIVGAGINGIGTFRDLSLQGVDCLIVDKGDFCSGASAAPSRLIHGGLKYLETGEFRLVAEATLERNRLLRNAGHLVRPLETMVPLFSWLDGIGPTVRRFFRRPARTTSRGAAIIEIGLSLYDYLGRRERVMPRHRFWRRQAALQAMPGLDPRLVAAASYYDAWITQPERLGLELVLDAETANPGSIGLNHVRLVGRDGGQLRFRDELSQEEFEVRPDLVINAGGAWIDRANQVMAVPSRYIGGTKGSHLLLDHPALLRALAGRMLSFATADGRLCLAFPFLDRVLTGSTDLRIDDPDQAACEDAEIDYILAALGAMFPGLSVERSHIVYTYCGVRPLPHSNAADVGEISRDHSVPIDEPTAERPFPILSLVGGKWTTFRAFAAETTDRVLARLGRQRRCSTELEPIGGGRGLPPAGPAQDAWIAEFAVRREVERERATALMHRYGSRAEAVARFCAAGADQPLKSLPAYTRREIEFIAREEQVGTLGDVLLRRTVIGITGRASLAVVQELAEVLGEVLGWDRTRREAEVAHIRADLADRHRVVLADEAPTYVARVAVPT
ncbi:glycerol-3-phosphate dehydrogenase/oxidase [Geminicoccus harenae]|uniref:glycerol-3-phosphate dehydrogenase/oxidase n=3 Tax=Geminicoccus harenae TaxID=2498453 RepID=UPI001C95B858|nr:glycerol-3-phosphate dehydrogenase/oxidase [Geminicoccus harenae]